MKLSIIGDVHSHKGYTIPQLDQLLTERQDRFSVLIGDLNLGYDHNREEVANHKRFIGCSKET